MSCLQNLKSEFFQILHIFVFGSNLTDQCQTKRIVYVPGTLLFVSAVGYLFYQNYFHVIEQNEERERFKEEMSKLEEEIKVKEKMRKSNETR